MLKRIVLVAVALGALTAIGLALPRGEPEQDDMTDLFRPPVATGTAPVAPPPAEGTKLVIYLAERDAQECTAADLVALERVVPPTSRPARDALDLLIAGPRPDEKDVSAVLPAGSRVNSVNIDEDGLARVDFNAAAESGGGACAMSLRRAAIERTMKQFPSVRDVRISVEGRTEGIFQP